MKKIAFSIVSILVLGHLAFAGGDIKPAEEPIVDVPAVAAVDTNEWQQAVTIYGWLAGIDADTKLPGNLGDTSINASDIIDNLQMVLMGNYAARYNKWSIIGDVIYMDIGSSAPKTFALPDGTVDTTVDMNIKSLIFDAGVGYNLIESEKGILDAVVGARYMGLDVDMNLGLPREPGLSASDDLVDAIIGLRGYYNIDEKWYLPYYADIGTGDSESTYQLFAGVAHRYDWGDVSLGYRMIGYNFGDDSLLDDLKLNGGVLAVSFKF